MTRNIRQTDVRLPSTFWLLLVALIVMSSQSSNAWWLFALKGVCAVLALTIFANYRFNRLKSG